MRHVFFAAIAITMACGPASAAAAGYSAADAKKYIADSEAAWCASEVTGDPSVALRLLADHTEHCVTEAIISGGGSQKVRELNDAVARLVRS